jgi:membrane associated rhomboid family serine protease
MANPQNSAPQERQPILNLPPVIIGCLAVLIGIHLARITFLGPEADFDLLLRFAFIPVRVMQPETVGNVIPGGPAAAWWSFVTYAFFHADWAHLGFNGLWLTAFGSPLAWRFGTTRFLLFSAVGAIAGALFYLAFNLSGEQPMIGASAAISAHMAGASRFVFSAGGPLRGFTGIAAYHRPAQPLGKAIGDPRVLAFLAVWFGLNLLFGFWGPDAGLASGAIAWEAHIGGFLAGLILFPIFDPVERMGGNPP